MEDYKEAVRLNPQLWQAYFNRAAELKERGKLREALADLDHVARLNPKFVGRYTNRANIYNRQGQLDKAICDYNAALQLGPQRYRSLCCSRRRFHAQEGLLARIV